MSYYINGRQMREAFHLAAERLQKEEKRLNELNLFPVADRDTGINMVLSMTKTSKALRADGTPFEIAEDAYLQLLEYGHGNSGNILTLFFEGFAYALPADATEISGVQLAYAFQKGAENAVCGIADPKTGTILSVAQQSAEAGISLAEVCEDAGRVFQRITEESHAALLLTPLQNPVLRPFHVVDAGAFGFCLMLDGFLSSFKPEASIPSYSDLQLPDGPSAEETEPSYPFCTEFLLETFPSADRNALEAKLRRMGDCFICAGTETLCKIHIHTSCPDQVLETAEVFGTVRRRKIEDMRRISMK